MSLWAPGEPVVCIAESTELRAGGCLTTGDFPKKGCKYIIDTIEMIPQQEYKGSPIFLVLVGVTTICMGCGERQGWHESGFKRIDPSENTKSLITGLLNTKDFKEEKPKDGTRKRHAPKRTPEKVGQ